MQSYGRVFRVNLNNSSFGRPGTQPRARVMRVTGFPETELISTTNRRDPDHFPRRAKSKHDHPPAPVSRVDALQRVISPRSSWRVPCVPQRAASRLGAAPLQDSRTGRSCSSVRPSSTVRRRATTIRLRGRARGVHLPRSTELVVTDPDGNDLFITRKRWGGNTPLTPQWCGDVLQGRFAGARLLVLTGGASGCCLLRSCTSCCYPAARAHPRCTHGVC